MPLPLLSIFLMPLSFAISPIAEVKSHENAADHRSMMVCLTASPADTSNSEIKKGLEGIQPL